MPPDTSSIRILPCKPGDWDRVTELLQTVFAGEGYTSSEHAIGAYTEQNLSAAGLTLVARDTTEILGTVLLLSPEDRLSQVANEGEMEFRLLAVEPRSRGRKIGEHLVRACIHRAGTPLLSVKRLVICTQPSMLAAQHLYERLGFVRAPDRDFSVASTNGREPPQQRLVYFYAFHNTPNEPGEVE